MQPLADRRFRTSLRTILAAGLCLLGSLAVSPGTSLGPHETALVIFRVTAPTATPPGAPLFIVGDFQGWDPGDPACALASIGGQFYEISLILTVGDTIQFKFTRGDWETVEKGPSGEEIPNRFHTVTGGETLDLTVGNWADLPISTATGDVTTHTVPGFLSGRRVWVYLPPNYHVHADQCYPVLYMFDGQNVFDQATSASGEWKADETCERLIAEGVMSPVIVVAVDNGGLDRVHEYTPWHDPGFGDGGGGEAHIQEYISVLMPWVNTNYRTVVGPQNTGLVGSSLGGLMCLYAVYAHPDVFGLIGALSPSIHWGDGRVLGFAMAQPKPSAKVYVDMGMIESSPMADEDENGVVDNIDDLRTMSDILAQQGFVPGGDVMVIEDEAGMHSEWCWARRLPGALQFLFPPTSE